MPFSTILNIPPHSYQEITEDEAKIMYCKGDPIYTLTLKQNLRKIPASYEYSSHAPASELFYRGIPQYEGRVQFFKKIK